MPLGKLAMAAIGVGVAGAVTVGVVVATSSSNDHSTGTPAASTGQQATNGPSASPPLADPSCQLESQLKSTDGKTPFNLTFANNTNETLQTLWLDYNGKRVFYRDIPPGTSYVQRTFITHPWVVADKSGRCLRLYVTDGRQNTVTVPMGSVAPAKPPGEQLAGPDLPGQPSATVNGTDRLTFDPQTVAVHVNDIVEWRNPGTIGHTITFDDAGLAVANDNRFDAGGVWRVKFTNRGNFTYVCTLHTDMKGTVSVS